MKVITMGIAEIQVTKEGIEHRWRLTGSKEWRKFPMENLLASYLRRRGTKELEEYRRGMNEQHSI